MILRKKYPTQLSTWAALVTGLIALATAPVLAQTVTWSGPVKIEKQPNGEQRLSTSGPVEITSASLATAAVNTQQRLSISGPVDIQKQPDGVQKLSISGPVEIEKQPNGEQRLSFSGPGSIVFKPTDGKDEKGVALPAYAEISGVAEIQKKPDGEQRLSFSGPGSIVFKPVNEMGGAGVALPADAAEVLKAFEQQQADIRREAEERIAKSREEAIQHLKALQDQHAKAGELDEAIAIRDRIRQIQGQSARHSYFDATNLDPRRRGTSHDPNESLIHNGNGDSLEALWRGASPDPGNLVGYRDRVGQSFLFDVTGRAENSIWGTGVYTDDSTLAAAAVHAGVLQPGERGVVRVTILPGLDSYEGIARNGVTSMPYPKWQGSYIVQAADNGLRRPGTAMQQLTPQILRAHVGGALTVEVVGSTMGTVWGTDIYTDDSSIPAAAVHAGLLKDGERGVIRVMPLPGQGSYEPSTRNGVSSQPWPNWDGSFRLSRPQSGSTVSPETELTPQPQARHPAIAF